MENQNQANKNSTEKTIFKIKRRESPFVQIDRAIAQNKTLSLRARGLLLYFLSLPEDFKIFDSFLNEISEKEGRDAIRTAVKELKDTGHYRSEPVKNSKGQVIQWITHIYEVPELDNPEVESQETGNPEAENQITGNPQQQINNINNKYLNINNTNKKPPIIPQGDESERASLEEEKNINTTSKRNFEEKNYQAECFQQEIPSLKGKTPTPHIPSAPPSPQIAPKLELEKEEIWQAKILSTPSAAKSKRRSRDELPAEQEAEFEELWALYGRKGGKAPARQSFAKALRKVSFENLKTAINCYLLSKQVQEGYKKDFSTYLNQECWESDFPPPPDVNAGKPPEVIKHEDRERKLKAYNFLSALESEIRSRKKFPDRAENIKFFAELAQYCQENSIDVNKIDEWLEATRKELTGE